MNYGRNTRLALLYKISTIKIFKDFMNLKIVFNNIDLEKVKKVFEDLKINIMHHVKQDYIISSFDKMVILIN